LEAEEERSMSKHWLEFASCREQAPAFDSYVDGETPEQRSQRLTAAVRACESCPVRGECEADIDPLLDDGVRAGVLLENIKNVRAGGGRGDVTGKRLARKAS
jgi:hypothetical protein